MQTKLRGIRRYPQKGSDIFFPYITPITMCIYIYTYISLCSGIMVPPSGCERRAARCKDGHGENLMLRRKARRYAVQFLVLPCRCGETSELGQQEHESKVERTAISSLPARRAQHDIASTSPFCRTFILSASSYSNVITRK